MTAQAQYSLEDRYQLQSGQVLLTGIQALVRALETRARLDQARGLQTGGYVSGYRGSPLGGLDKELWQREAELGELDIKFQPGVNEDLAATSVWGTQQVGLHTGHRVDGVYGLWYGKAPGLDRSCDAIRHANAWGTSAQGGVVLVVGDDPQAKSSSLATQSEFTLQDLMVPILAPANVQDVLDFTVLGWEMSRESGLWVGLKAIADHMDSGATVEVGLDRYDAVAEDRAGHYIRLEDTPQAQEVRILNEKLPAAIEFARRAGLNKWLTKGLAAPQAKQNNKQKLGIICAGKAYSDIREALVLLGLFTEQDISTAGIELLKLGMTWPLQDDLVRDFAASVDRVWVVEEKRAFVETQLKEMLYSQDRTPIFGKFDAQGEPLVPATGILEPAELAFSLNRMLGGLFAEDSPVFAEIKRTESVVAEIHAPARSERTPLFCAGCPHNTSTRVPEGSRATAGIGCHYMVQWMERRTDSCTHMGGEGVTWVGEAPFTEEQHIFANLGDGTYFHSGILAIRQAVAAGVNITYKVLFNDAVAMTGGQPTDGELTVDALIAQVQAEGVAEVVVVSENPGAHEHLKGVRVHHRRDLDEVQRRLRTEQGVSVLIYEQTCATELRRRRKRGLIEDTKPRLMINEAVCEGCGDCTEKSSCVAVEPKHTALGLKRQINQTSCNKDLSCAEGFCPAFVEVRGGSATATIEATEENAQLVEPTRPEQADILITGVGGTGIVTVSALLATAAKVEGKEVRSLDMTGLAQKSGAVFSHVRIAPDASLHTPRIPVARADVLLGCDLVTAASEESLAMLNGDSQVVINAHVLPTADFVLGHDSGTHARQRVQRLKKITTNIRQVSADEAVIERFGDATQSNVFLLGFAYQLGGLPLAAASIERAIELNGAQVERNLAAFAAGRLAVVEGFTPDTKPERPADSLSELMSDHVRALQGYQGNALLGRYRALVQAVQQLEQDLVPGSEVLSRAVAQSYLPLLMIKDEYEVARLYTDGEFARSLATQFGRGAKVRYLLAPPLLGTRKRSFGGWMKVAFKLLAAMKGIRNKWYDPFAYSKERKQELAVLAEFEGVVAELVENLDRQNLPIAVRLAKLYSKVRGFGHVRAAKYEAILAERDALLAEFRAPAQVINVFDPNARAA